MHGKDLPAENVFFSLKVYEIQVNVFGGRHAMTLDPLKININDGVSSVMADHGSKYDWKSMYTSLRTRY